jgi:hypothetical protein
MWNSTKWQIPKIKINNKVHSKCHQQIMHKVKIKKCLSIFKKLKIHRITLKWKKLYKTNLPK